MPKISLNDASVRNFQPPSKGSEDHWDDKLPGFGVRVSQGGSKTFVLKLDNSRRAIGRYPIISLSEARIEAKRMLAERTLGKHRPQNISYEDAVKQFLEEKRKNRRTSTVDGYAYYIEGAFKGRLVQASHAEVLRKLNTYKTTGSYNHALWAYRAFFNWCAKRRMLTDNPITGISNRATKRRSRVLTDEELIKIWRAAEQTEGSFGIIVRVLICSAMRRSECAALRAGYYSHNQQTLTLPGEITKNRRALTLPIGTLCASILHPLLQDLEQDALLFPARGKKTRPFNGWSKSKKALDTLSGVTGWVLHDLRRTARTNFGRLGISPHIGERLVNHISAQTDMEQTYDIWTYLPEMQEAMNKWEDHLSRILMR